MEGACVRGGRGGGKRERERERGREREHKYGRGVVQQTRTHTRITLSPYMQTHDFSSHVMYDNVVLNMTIDSTDNSKQGLSLSLSLSS